jgi:hypothetical protein
MAHALGRQVIIVVCVLAIRIVKAVALVAGVITGITLTDFPTESEITAFFVFMEKYNDPITYT